LPVQVLSPGTQTPVQLPSVHTNGQLVPFVHLPAALQIWGIAPMHFFAPGTHSPVHAPPLQMNGQSCVSTHCASTLHVCFFLPLQLVGPPGTHTPAQAPALHVNGQTASFHAPFALQVRSTLVTQVDAPGVQTPSHFPLVALQSEGQTMLSTHLPPTQVCEVLLEHCVAPSVHPSVHLPRSHNFEHATPSFSHDPLAEHFCG